MVRVLTRETFPAFAVGMVLLVSPIPSVLWGGMTVVTPVLLGHTSLGDQDLGEHVPRNMSDGGPKPLLLQPGPLHDLLPLSPGVCCCCSSCPPVILMWHWWKRPHYIRIRLAVLLWFTLLLQHCPFMLCNLPSFPDFRKLFPGQRKSLSGAT